MQHHFDQKALLQIPCPETRFVILLQGMIANILRPSGNERKSIAVFLCKMNKATIVVPDDTTTTLV